MSKNEENGSVSSSRGKGTVSQLTNTPNKKLDTIKLNGTLEILRKEISIAGKASYNELLKNENVVLKEEKIEIHGREMTVRRVYMLFGAYRIGWVIDDDILHCMECQAEFNFLNRRHHCRACGNIICSNCSPYKATIPTLDEPNGSRVCNNCFGLKVNLHNIRQYANLEEFDSFETISSSDEVGSSYSGGLSTGMSPIERDLRHQEHLQMKREQKALSRQKLIEQSRKPQYLRAHRTMRAIVPPDISETNLQAMLRAGLPKPVAERIWKCRCLWLLSMHPDDIKKIHIADFRSKYAPVGLDLTELRAVWHCLPDWDINDEKEKEKAQWKMNLKIQMDDMVRKEERGELPEELRRNQAYLGYEPIRVYSSAPTNITKRYSATAEPDPESSNIDTNEIPKDVDLKLSNVSSTSYHTPPRKQPSRNEQKFYPSPLSDDIHRRYSFSDAGSLSPQTPSPYKTDDRRRHRPHICHSPHSSPPITLFLYRQTSGDLAATEDRGKSFSLPPEMRKDDVGWIDRFREFFLGETPRKASKLTKTQSEPPKNNESVLGNESKPLFTKRGRSMTDLGQSEHQSSQLPPSGKSHYRLRREEEKKSLNQERQTSHSPSRSPFSVRTRSHSDRIPREKTSSPSPVEVVPASPTPAPGSPGSSEQDSPSKNSDNCTPVRTRVPFFPPESLTPPRSPSSRTNKMSSNTSTLLTPQPPKREAPKPPLTATPLREMMASLAPTAIVQKIKESDLRMSPSEATDLLKYLIVNYGDLNSEYLLPEKESSKTFEQIEQEEKSLLQTLSMLITKCDADVNSLDRDGNSLLSFIVQYNFTPDSSAVSEVHLQRKQAGINKLVSSLVFHGIELFIKNPINGKIEKLHEAFLALTQADKLQLIDQFLQAEVENDETGISNNTKAALTSSQLLNYCIVLILIGRVKYPTQLLSSHVIELSESHASAILKSCQFDNMEDPVEAFELLDRCGAQL